MSHEWERSCRSAKAGHVCESIISDPPVAANGSKIMVTFTWIQLCQQEREPSSSKGSIFDDNYG